MAAGGVQWLHGWVQEAWCPSRNAACTPGLSQCKLVQHKALGAEQLPVPEGKRAVCGPREGPVCASMGSSIQLSRPRQDPALAKVRPQGFPDTKGCQESPAHAGAPCLGSQASDSSLRLMRRLGCAGMQTLLQTRLVHGLCPMCVSSGFIPSAAEVNSRPPDVKLCWHHRSHCMPGVSWAGGSTLQHPALAPAPMALGMTRASHHIRSAWLLSPA